nr:hypothetical protein [Rhodococcus wratislaviensis]GLK38671.1 hypothetical protein GCM10017611_55380 [Rhodococcus wratislaviensis]
MNEFQGRTSTKRDCLDDEREAMLLTGLAAALSRNGIEELSSNYRAILPPVLEDAVGYIKER